MLGSNTLVNPLPDRVGCINLNGALRVVLPITVVYIRARSATPLRAVA